MRSLLRERNDRITATAFLRASTRKVTGRPKKSIVSYGETYFKSSCGADAGGEVLGVVIRHVYSSLVSCFHSLKTRYLGIWSNRKCSKIWNALYFFSPWMWDHLDFHIYDHESFSGCPPLLSSPHPRSENMVKAYFLVKKDKVTLR